ncbi:hypothetical protein BT63DRAFT_451344 [Microthyrium microscopicum]|uniref:Uncharacterized protein n=1 Tax=Microthyrium microscopicum TaxID=703497 RepID=A0A6A6UPF2_9PEZI|nr:hypothetical protein BT63DRAFT_451344 [Microthyrium microscopicum]
MSQNLQGSPAKECNCCRKQNTRSVGMSSGARIDAIIKGSLTHNRFPEFWVLCTLSVAAITYPWLLKMELFGEEPLKGIFIFLSFLWTLFVTGLVCLFLGFLGVVFGVPIYYAMAMLYNGILDLKTFLASTNSCNCSCQPQPDHPAGSPTSIS